MPHPKMRLASLVLLGFALSVVVVMCLDPDIIAEELPLADLGEIDLMQTNACTSIKLGSADIRNIKILNLRMPKIESYDLSMPDISFTLKDFSIQLTGSFVLTVDFKNVLWPDIRNESGKFNLTATGVFVDLEGTFGWNLPQKIYAPACDPNAPPKSIVPKGVNTIFKKLHFGKSKKKKEAEATGAAGGDVEGKGTEEKKSPESPKPLVTDFPVIQFVTKSSCTAGLDLAKLDFRVTEFMDKAKLLPMFNKPIFNGGSFFNDVVNFVKKYLPDEVLRDAVCSGGLIDNLNNMLMTQPEMITKIIAYFVGNRWEKGMVIKPMGTIMAEEEAKRREQERKLAAAKAKEEKDQHYADGIHGASPGSPEPSAKPEAVKHAGEEEKQKKKGMFGIKSIKMPSLGKKKD